MTNNDVDLNDHTDALYVRVPEDYCLHRNGLTCGGTEASHPRSNGPMSEHEFVSGAMHFIPVVRAERTETGWRQLPTPDNGWDDAFVPKQGNDRAYADPDKPGRRDLNGEEWWACDPYPTWYRWADVDGERQLLRRSDQVKWA